MSAASFFNFAALCERLGTTTSRLERAQLISEYLRGVSAAEAEVAARWLVGRAFEATQGKKLSLSGRAAWDALGEMGVDVQSANWAGAVDFGELVRQAVPATMTPTPTLSLLELFDAFSAIAAASGAGS